jgi:hypothetical protein
MRALPLAALLLLAACGVGDTPTIDGSSDAAFKASMAEVRADLTPAERAKFEGAVKLMEASAFAKSDSRAEMRERMRRKLGGKTAQQVIDDAAAQQKDLANAAVDQVFRIKKEVTRQVDDLKDEGATQ